MSSANKRRSDETPENVTAGPPDNIAAGPPENVAAGPRTGRSPHESLPPEIESLLRESPIRLVYGPGRIDDLGEQARSEGATRVLLVTDPGLERAGHAGRAARSLRNVGLTVTIFDGVQENPTTRHVAAGVQAAQRANVDLIVAVGGGSSMDCAKGLNLLYTNGGQMRDFLGDAPPEELANRKPLLPMICVPTTTGTGSESQSFALISDTDSHMKMAYGDRRPPAEGGLRPRVAILDPELTRTQPPNIVRLAGIDSISHAVETAGTNARNDRSRKLSREAWRRLSSSYEQAMRDPDDDAARTNMLLGAHLAGMAIEHSMLGAAHACANPLTARYGIVHGQAVGLMLPHVVRFNTTADENPYADLDDDLRVDANPLPERLTRLLVVAGLRTNLRELAVPESDLPLLGELAAQQWTAQFNPRPVAATEFLGIYRAAF